MIVERSSNNKSDNIARTLTSRSTKTMAHKPICHSLRGGWDSSSRSRSCTSSLTGYSSSSSSCCCSKYIHNPHSDSHPGIYHGRVLSSDMDRRAAEIRGPYRDPAAQQPDGQQDLDAGHLFPEWQEVDLSQHDHPQQAVPHHAERNYPLHHEVNSAGQCSSKPPPRPE